jgi:hypothetical protein
MAVAPIKRRAVLMAYAIVALAAMAIVAWQLQLWERDLRVPIVYAGDAIDIAAHLKSLIEHGTHVHHPSLGAPGDGIMYDYPVSEPFHLWVMYGLVWFGLEIGTAMNVYYLLGFPLAAVCMMFVLRHFGIGVGPAGLAGLLYACLHYHFARGLPHVHLASYYMIPPMMMVVLWIMQRGSIFFVGAEHRRTRVPISLLITLVIATATLYYAVFACYLLLVAGLAGAAVHRSLRPLVSCGLLILTIATVFFASTIEARAYQQEHGRNPTLVRHRQPQQVEELSLKITQLLLPVTDHRVDSIAFLKKVYNRNQAFGAPATEADMASLGLIGSLGFLAMLCVILFRWRSPLNLDEPPKQSLTRDLSILNLALVLLGTQGGIGMVFAVLVSPEIRAYNRVSVVIAFCAFFVVAIGLDFVRKRLGRTRAGTVAFHTCLLALLGVGLLDQIPKHRSRAEDRDLIRLDIQRFESDREFMRAVGTTMPRGSMIFQLPHHGFPEIAPPRGVRMAPYDQLLPYFHSTGFRWSYGSIRGRGTDAWLKKVAGSDSADQFLKAIAFAGFTGLWIDSFGFTEDEYAGISLVLKSTLDAPKLKSPDGRFDFFDLRAVFAKDKATMGADAWDRGRRATLPVYPFFSVGFFGPELSPDGPFRWAETEADLYFQNPLPIPRRIRLHMNIVSATGSGRLVIRGGGREGEQIVELGSKPVAFERVIDIPAGSSNVALRFSCDAQHSRIGDDLRLLAFRVSDVRTSELTGSER